MNTKCSLFIFLTVFIQLPAMVQQSFDKQLMELNATLEILINNIGSQSVIIGDKEIQLTKEQFDNLQLESSANFSKVIQDMVQDTEKGDPIVLPPVVDPEAFQYLVNWQPSLLPTLDNDLIIKMINAANFFHMDQIINTLINILYQGQDVSLHSNPLLWWNTIGKQLNLPEELQAKLSALFFPDIHRVLFSHMKQQIPTTKAHTIFFQPKSEFINLAVNTLYTPQAKTGMIYQADEKFIFKPLPDCPKCALQKHIWPQVGPVGWNSTGQWLLVYMFYATKNDVIRLFHWDHSLHTWQEGVMEKSQQIEGRGLSWSPDGNYIVIDKSLSLPTSEILFYKYNKNYWQEVAKIQLRGIHSLSWSPDSKHVAVITGFGQQFTLVEQINNDNFEISFNHTLDQNLSKLIWQPGNLTLGVVFEKGQIQLWGKKDNQWVVEQTIEPKPAFKQSKEIYSYFKWSLDGKYLITYSEISDREESSFNVWHKEKDQWVIKNTLALNAKNMRIVDLYWNKNNQFLALVGNSRRKPTGFFGAGRDISEIQLWSQEENSWKPTIIPLNKTMKDWDVLYNADNNFRSLATVDDDTSEISLWNLEILNQKLYFNLEQIVQLVDWHNKINRGEKVSLPKF